MNSAWRNWRRLLGPNAAPVSRILAVCQQQGVRLAIVGGGVRDILLGREFRDLDLVVEGSAPEVLSAVCDAHGGIARTHAQFGTATWCDPQGMGVDLASARSEHYPHSGALPMVEMASLEADLARRDFSINAMALVLSDNDAELLDPHGGRRDLEHRRLVLLHAQSLADDPTRIWRGVRFMARLSLELGVSTSEWWQRALDQDVLSRVSLQRIGAEIHRCFEEENREQVWRVAQRWGLWQRLSTELANDEWVSWRSDSDQSSPALSWLAMATALSPVERERLLPLVPGAKPAHQRWLHGPERIARAVTQMKALNGHFRPSVVARIVAGLDEVEMRMLWTRLGQVKAGWLDWWRQEGHAVRSVVTGQGLIARGFSPGPRFASAKAAALDAARDGGSAEEQWSRAISVMEQSD